MFTARLRSAKAGPGAARRQDALEAFAGFRQLGGQERVAAMRFRANVGGHQPDDAFAIGLGQFRPTVYAPTTADPPTGCGQG